MNPEALPVSIAGRRFELLPGRGLLWPDRRALLVADLHLGKDASFRAAGMGVPSSSTDATLQSVSEMIQGAEVQELYILGDLFHARSSLSLHATQSFEAFCRHHAGVAIVLIRGNHDRAVGQLPKRWPMTVIPDQLEVDGVRMTHHPGPCTEDAELLVCGHLHPAYELQTRSESTGKQPAFWWDSRRRCLVLPAVGQFTGTAKVTARPGDHVWIVADEQVHRVA